MKIKRQQNESECGLYVIQGLHHHYFKSWININNLKSAANLTAQGLNIANLIALGQKFNLELKAFKGDLSAFKANNSLGIILLKQESQLHYVIAQAKRSHFLIWDPSKGHYALSWTQLIKLYAGIFIKVEPKTRFEITKKLDFKSEFKNYLYANTHLFMWIFLALLVNLILSFTATLFMKIIFDQVLPGRLKNVLLVLCLGFIFLSFLKVMTNFTKGLFNKKLTNLVEIDLTHKYIDQFKLANSFNLNKLSYADHIRRLAMIPSVALFLATALQVMVYETITFTIAISMLIWISPQLFGVLIGMGVCNLIGSFSLNLLVQRQYWSFLQASKHEMQQRHGILYAHNNLKEPRRALFLYSRWRKQFIDSKEHDYKTWKLNVIAKTFESFCNAIMPIVITYLAVGFIFENKLTSGSFLMFLGIFNYFLSPLNAFSDFMLKFKQNLVQINLLKYVLELKPIEENKHGFKVKALNSIELKNIKLFLDKPILAIKKLKIKQSIKLIGANGVGKTMLIKTILNQTPFSGTLSFNNLNKDYLALNHLYNKFLFISTEEYLPNAKVIDYIIMDNDAGKEQWNSWDQQLNLTGFLLKNGIILEDLLGENGQNFSQGQRQIIKLMRIFSNKFEFLILDEAFEFMSLANFNFFKAKIKFLNPKIIEVSHTQRYVMAGQEVNLEAINDYY